MGDGRTRVACPVCFELVPFGAHKCGHCREPLSNDYWEAVLEREREAKREAERRAQIGSWEALVVSLFFVASLVIGAFLIHTYQNSTSPLEGRGTVKGPM